MQLDEVLEAPSVPGSALSLDCEEVWRGPGQGWLRGRVTCAAV